ncbi:hypothetical protein [Streptomyces sp. NPDC048438]|uniref:hypothetical protein n=1 Tax=Streptomyces sp. NPDC048438 TaxID=3365551 RepID=UPI0037229C77
MAAWIAFWTAAWVGSAWLYRHFLACLIGRPAMPEEQPEQTPDTEEDTDQDQEAKEPIKAPATPRRSAGGVLVRLLLLVLAAGFIRGLPHTTDILLTLAATWAVTSIVAGFAIALSERPTDSKEEKQDQEQAGPDPADTLTRDDVAPLLHGLLQDTGGVHLKALSKVLPARPKRAPWATGDVRALLGRVGIRVRDGVRVPGVGGREGVHRDDVPPLPSPASGAPLVGVVVPGRSNNNNAYNTPGFTVTDDPDNPAQHHVHHSERT